MELDTLEELSLGKKPNFTPLAVYPAVRRDITFICPQTIPVKDVLDAIYKNKGKYFTEAELRDLYLPKDSAERNLTFRLTFQSPDKTLEDKDVDKEREKITQAVTKALNIRV